MRNATTTPATTRTSSSLVDHVLLTPEQAAESLGIGRWKLYDLLRRGELASIRIGSCRRIPTSALNEYVAELRRRQVTWAS